MSFNARSANGMGAVTEPTPGNFQTTGMGVEDHMHISQDYLVSGGGVVNITTDLSVTQRGAGANMSVDVSAGSCYVPNSSFSENSVSQNRYWSGVNDATINTAISANSSGNPRITSVFVKFDTSATPDTSGSNLFTIVTVDGTPGVTPTAPATPSNHLRLADVTVANGASSITNANISDKRIQMSISPWKLPRVENTIINANCKVNQRLTTPTVTTSYLYGPVDRFAVKATGTAVNAGTYTQTSSANVGITGYALKMSGMTITGTGIVYMRYRVEARDALIMKNQNASIALGVYHDVGSSINYTIFVSKATVADNFTATTAISNSGAISVATGTPTTIKYENWAAGDVSNGIEIEVQAACGAVTTKNFEFTDLVLNPGANAQRIQVKNYVEDLNDCRRYFRPIVEADAGVSQADILFANRLTAAIVAVTIPIQRMRTTPTLVSTFGSYVTTNPSSDGQYTFFDWSAGAFLNNNSGTITISLSSIGPTFAVIRYTNSVNFSNGSVNNLVSLELRGAMLALLSEL